MTDPLETRSNCPAFTADILNVNPGSGLSTSVADSMLLSKMTEVPSLMLRLLLPSTGTSLASVTVMLKPAVSFGSGVTVASLTCTVTSSRALVS